MGREIEKGIRIFSDSIEIYQRKKRRLIEAIDECGWADPLHQLLTDHVIHIFTVGFLRFSSWLSYFMSLISKYKEKPKQNLSLLKMQEQAGSSFPANSLPSTSERSSSSALHLILKMEWRARKRSDEYQRWGMKV